MACLFLEEAAEHRAVVASQSDMKGEAIMANAKLGL